MDSILAKLAEPKAFDAFIQENMKRSTYVAEWKTEMKDPEYCAGKVYQAFLAEYTAAMVGSVIDKNAEKPTHQMPKASQLIGTVGRMGDEWQMDLDRLEQFFYMEGRFRNKSASFSEEQRKAEFAKLVKFLFDPYEKAVIAPHKRLDMLYFEGLFNGTQTVSLDNNKKSGVQWSYPLGVKTFKVLGAIWRKENATTMTPIADITNVLDYIDAKGKTVKKIRMSKKTFRNMVYSEEIWKSLTLKLAKLNIQPAAVISLDMMNEYATGMDMPSFETMKKSATLQDGSEINLIPDDRVVFMCADKVAVPKVSDPLELIDKLPNKVYSSYDDNLVGYYRNEKGRFVDYEMWATPVFDGRNDYFILKTDESEKG